MIKNMKSKAKKVLVVALVVGWGQQGNLEARTHTEMHIEMDIVLDEVENTKPKSRRKDVDHSQVANDIMKRLKPKDRKALMLFGLKNEELLTKLNTTLEVFDGYEHVQPSVVTAALGKAFSATDVKTLKEFFQTAGGKEVKAATFNFLSEPEQEGFSQFFGI